MRCNRPRSEKTGGAAERGRLAGWEISYVNERLLTLLPPPATHRRMTGDACTWAEVEAALGLALPPDFRTFCDRYGPGEIDQLMAVLVPVTVGQYLRDVDLVTSTVKYVYEEYGDPDEPHQFYPTVPGLLPFGDTDGGEVFWWLADRGVAPEHWPVVVTPRHVTWASHTFGMCFSDFLVGVLLGDIEIDFHPLPKDYAPQFITRQK